MRRINRLAQFSCIFELVIAAKPVNMELGSRAHHSAETLKDTGKLVPADAVSLSSNSPAWKTVVPVRGNERSYVWKPAFPIGRKL